jgi:hypothetical protein
MSVSNGKISARMGKKIGVNGDGDLQVVFGTSQKSHAWFFTTAPINMYSAHKPFRSSTIFTDHYDDTNSQRYAWLSANSFGVSANTTLNRSIGAQDPYWKYARPRGSSYNEHYRAEDFELYNHNAVCPMLATNITLSTNGEIHIDLSTIINTSSNVEIPLHSVIQYPDQDYVGFVLWDITKKVGYYLVTDVYVSDLFDGIPSSSWHDFYKNIVELPFSDEDDVEFFWCTNPTNTIVHDQGGDYPAFVKLTSGNVTAISLMACDSTHGHTTFHILKFNVHTDIGFVNLNTIIGGAWNANRTNFTFNSFSTRLQCTYSWRTNESYPVSFRMVIGLNTTTATLSSNRTLSSANASQYFDLAMSNGSKTFDITTLRDLYDYVVPLYLYVKLTDSDDEVRLVTINYNVQTGTYTYST